MRIAKIKRKTEETSVEIKINLDGKGKSKIETGIGFLNHMLELFSKHSLIDINLVAKGDIHVDEHHTTEDVGIVLGQAVAQALGKKIGIKRFGTSYVPMDETLTRVSIDVSNRPYLVWKVNLKIEKLGEMDTELFKEWFQAFSQNAGLTVHIENLYGDNTHHIVESCFKALAQALKKSVEIDKRSKHILPSTKGKL